MGNRSAFLTRILPLAFLSVLWGCDTLPDHLKEDISEKRLAETGIESLDPTGDSPSAGLSILREIDVAPIRSREIGSDTVSEGFHRLVHRCGTCHATPSPKIRTAAQWRTAFSRMEKHMRESGLIPLSEGDRTLILAFLQKHAAAR